MAKRDKGFKDIMRGLRKNPALLIALVVAAIVIFVLISKSQGTSASADTTGNQGLPNGTGGSNYYLVGLGQEYATGGPWDSFYRQHPGSYHNHRNHVSAKSHHDHKKHHEYKKHHDSHNKKKHH